METSSVIIEKICGCNKHTFCKVRFYPVRIDTSTPFDKLPKYDGIAFLSVMDDSAHISGLVFSGYSRFRRMHDYDFEQQFRQLYPVVKVVYWERHKGGEVIQLVRNLD